MHETSYNELTITGFPKGEYVVVYPQNIDKYPDNTLDYFSKLALRNLSTGHLKIITRNIKEVSAITLGTIIRDQKLSTDKIGSLYNFCASINNPQSSAQLPKHFIDGSIPYFRGFTTIIPMPNKHFYNPEYHTKAQTGIELHNNQGIRIFFPSYVISQYFYFRSASLIKQIMSATHKHSDAVRGLYKKIVIAPSGEASILLIPGTSPNDAAEIFRFAVDPVANYYFNKIYPDIVDSHLKNQAYAHKEGWAYAYNTAVLQSFFPCDADVDITFRGLQLDKEYFLALEIIQENSPYPFERLTIYSEDPKRENHVIAVGRVNKKIRAHSITKVVSKLTPHSKYEDIKISNGVQTDGRYGLIGKIITNEKIIVSTESEITKLISNSNDGVDLNSNHDDLSGDDMTVQMNPAFSNFEEFRTCTIPNLDNFKDMLFITSDKNKTFSFTVSPHLPFPQKPINDPSKKKWLRSFLKKDNRTPRSYMIARINYDNCTYTAIEIEKDERISKVSTLILKMNDHTKIPDDIIASILIDYVKEERSWLHKIIPTAYEHKTLIHPHDSKNKNIEEWSQRLLNILNSL